jgi:hypothetical protein
MESVGNQRIQSTPGENHKKENKGNHFYPISEKGKKKSNSSY